MLERTIGATWALWFYLAHIVWPANLSPLYAQWTLDATSLYSYLPGVALAGLAAVCWKYRAGWARHALFALGYFAVMLLPVLGFFNMYFFTYARVADHWVYLSLIGVVGLVTGGTVHLAAKWLRVPANRFDGRIAMAGAAVALGLSVMTWNYAGAYSDEETLWRYTLERNPKAWAAHNNLGLIAEERGEWNAAEAHYREALAIKPDFAKAHYNLGLLSERLGRRTDAAHHYSEAIRIQPHYAECHNNLAVLLFHQDRNEEAIGHYLKALQFRSDFALAHYNLSFSLLKAGRRDDAIEHLRKALALQPNHSDTAIQLDRLLAEAGPME
jgi:protein O-mannosyl-transferase